MSNISIEIDGITSEVDEDAYASDPDLVIGSVRAARAEATDLTGLHEEFEWDYDGLVAEFGEDYEGEVEDDAGE